jgi:hypothetical protein
MKRKTTPMPTIFRKATVNHRASVPTLYDPFKVAVEPLFVFQPPQAHVCDLSVGNAQRASPDPSVIRRDRGADEP